MSEINWKEKKNIQLRKLLTDGIVWLHPDDDDEGAFQKPPIPEFILREKDSVLSIYQIMSTALEDPPSEQSDSEFEDSDPLDLGDANKDDEKEWDNVPNLMGQRIPADSDSACPCCVIL